MPRTKAPPRDLKVLWNNGTRNRNIPLSLKRAKRSEEDKNIHYLARKGRLLLLLGSGGRYKTWRTKQRSKVRLTQVRKALREPQLWVSCGSDMGGKSCRWLNRRGSASVPVVSSALIRKRGRQPRTLSPPERQKLIREQS